MEERSYCPESLTAEYYFTEPSEIDDLWPRSLWQAEATHQGWRVNTHISLQGHWGQDDDLGQ